MFQKQILEEGTMSTEPRDGTNSVSGNFQKSCSGFIKANSEKFTDFYWSCKYWILYLWSIMAVGIDDLFLYMYLVNDDRKSIEFDEDLWITFRDARLLVDLLYLIDKIFRVHTGIPKGEAKWYWIFLVDVLFLLPVPQVLMCLLLDKRLTRMDFLRAIQIYNLQQVVRTFQLFWIYLKGQASRKHFVFITAFAFFYLKTAHIVGAIWYVFAIERLSSCWERAYIEHTGCSYGNFDCHKPDDFTFLNEYCPTKTYNSTLVDYGIFRDVIQSGILEMTGTEKKAYYCLRWALQSISTFGQGLQTSTSTWEIVFALVIGTSTLLLLGNSQTLFQRDPVRSSEGMRQKERKLQQWLPFGKLSKNLQKEINYEVYRWQETRDIHAENLVNNLSNDIVRDLKRQLCLKMLKKVKQFGKLRIALLEDLCDFLEPVTHTELSYFVHEGEPIDKMLFVLQGQLRIYNSMLSTDNQNSERDYLNDGDIFGEEIVAWAQVDSPSSSDLPISTRTIQAHTDVEAFILHADALKHALLIGESPFCKAVRFGKSLFRDVVKGTFLQSRSETQRVTREQTPPTASEQAPISTVSEQTPATESEQEPSEHAALKEQIHELKKQVVNEEITCQHDEEILNRVLEKHTGRVQGTDDEVTTSAFFEKIDKIVTQKMREFKEDLMEEFKEFYLQQARLQFHKDQVEKHHQNMPIAKLSSVRKIGSQDMPPIVKNIFSFARNMMKTGESIKIYFDPNMFYSGTEMMYLGKEDILQFCRMEQISVSVIKVYMRLLFDKLKKQNLDKKYNFVDPEIFSDEGTHNSEEKGKELGVITKLVVPKQLIIIPYNELEHWMLVVIDLHEEQAYFFDSIGKEPRKKLKEFVNCALRMSSATYGENGPKNCTWKTMKCPRLLNNFECGYYVMKYMRDIMDNTNVSILEKFVDIEAYSQSEIDAIRYEWAKYTWQLTA